jgi:hypothetical protein
LGFSVEGVGLMVEGAGFRVWFRGEGAGLTAKDLVRRMSGEGFRVEDEELVKDSGLRIEG